MLSADGFTLLGVEMVRGTVRVWDLTGTAPPTVLTGHTGGVSAVAVSADGHTAVSGGYDGTVRIWDLASGREQVRWTADTGVQAVAFNAAIVAASDSAGQVHALQLNVPAAASV